MLSSKKIRSHLSWALHHTLIPRRYKQAQFEWRWIRNFARTRRHKLDDGRTRHHASEAQALRSEGIIVRNVQDIFDQDGLRLLDEIKIVVDEKTQEEKARLALAEPGSVAGFWNFRMQLVTSPFEAKSPFVQLAIQPQLLSLVNQYLGMRGYLRWIDVWYDYPTPDAASDTQLWHRDFDDLLNVKVFIYLNDVGKESGPFCFIPRTHPQGGLSPAKEDAEYRVTDADMEQAFDPSKWQVNTGPSGTVIFADTNGYHKGLKPETGHRVLLMFQYTSPARKGWRNFSLQGLPEVELDAIQKAALVA